MQLIKRTAQTCKTIATGSTSHSWKMQTENVQASCSVHFDCFDYPHYALAFNSIEEIDQLKYILNLLKHKMQAD